MITIKLINSIGEPPVVASGRSLVVEDLHGNPIVAVMSLADNGYSIAKVDDGEDFHKLLRSMGMDRLVVVGTLEAPKPPNGAKFVQPEELAEVIE